MSICINDLQILSLNQAEAFTFFTFLKKISKFRISYLKMMKYFYPYQYCKVSHTTLNVLPYIYFICSTYSLHPMLSFWSFLILEYFITFKSSILGYLAIM